MAEEHIVDRLAKAMTAERQGNENVQSLIAKLSEAAQRLRNWETVALVWHDERGMSHEQGVGPQFIQIDDVPTLHDIREAIAKWNAANTDVQGLRGQLTNEQRQVFGLPSR